MKIEFASRRLEACALRTSEAVRAWGPVVGRRYVQRIELLRALDLPSIQSSASLRAHPLQGAKAPHWALTLHDRWRIECTFEGDTLRVEEVSNHYGD